MSEAKNDPLFSLIKSLDQSEKRYFRIFTRQHVIEGENYYLELFDRLDAQDQYDERKLLRSLSSPVFARSDRSPKPNLSSGKNYLFNLLLKCLRNYHASRSTQIRLREMLIEIQILLDRGLWTLAEKQIRKAQKMADEHQMTLPALELSMIQRNIIRRFYQKDAAGAIEAEQQKSDRALTDLNLESSVLDIYDDVFLHYRNDVRDVELLRSLDARWQAAEQATRGARSFEARYMLHLTGSFLRHLQGDARGTAEHLEALVGLFEEHEKLKTELQERYINVLSNLASVWLELGETEKLPRILDFLKNVQPSSRRTAAILFGTRAFAEQNLLLRSGRVGEAVELGKKIEAELPEHERTMQKSRVVALRFNNAVACFLARNWNATLNSLHWFLDRPGGEIRPDIQRHALLLKIITHFELKSYDFVEYQLIAFRRHLDVKPKQASAEAAIVSALLRAVKTGSHDPLKKLLENWPGGRDFEEVRDWLGWRFRKVF